MTSGALLWEVILPEQGAAPLGARKPQGKLVVHRASGDMSTMLPKTVARILAAKQKSGEICPQTEAELYQIVDDLSYSCARTRIQRLIDRREYSCQEVRQKLLLDGYAPATIDAYLQRACEVGLVSDRRYADSFIRSKLYAGWGSVRIRSELARRGISVDDLPGWPYDYFDPEDELERACSAARSRSISGRNSYEKTVRFLYNRGFTMSIAMQAAQAVLAEQRDEAYDWS